MPTPASDDPTGRAWDAAIAHDLFGLEVEERTNTRTKARDFVCREPAKHWVRVPYYATSFSASLKVGDALRQRGWNWWFAPIAGPVVEVPITHEDGRTVKGERASTGEAPCRAALKALAGPASEFPVGRSLIALASPQVAA